MFEVCEVDAGFPETLNIELFDAGKIVSISLPSGVPVNGIPRLIVDPLILIVVGVDELKVA